MKTIILSIVGIVVFVFVVGGITLSYKQTFDPAMANVNRETFKNSQAYIDGKTNDLEKLRRQYNNANAEDKKIIKSYILETASTVDIQKLPSQTRKFVEEIQK